MFEKVNPSHPDKVADRIAGAIVDLAYKMVDNPRVAVEVLIGHGLCTVITESSVGFDINNITDIVERIAGSGLKLKWVDAQQDAHLANNQKKEMRCGDNGIFKGMPMTFEQHELTRIALLLYKDYPTDGKFIMDMERGRLIACQSNSDEYLEKRLSMLPLNGFTINPLGNWTGGTNVDTGATNRKLGSDMGDSITGGGLHGKDLSKADVSINIYAWLKAQELGKPVEMYCAIGDAEVVCRIKGDCDIMSIVPYSEIVEVARKFIFEEVGGFEKFAEWGLV